MADKNQVTGKKFDTAKIRMDLIPGSLLRAVGTVLTSGAAKYGDRNWEHGLAWGRVYGAILRHLVAWWAGEHLDPESGKSHLWHAACELAFLIEYESKGTGIDDRPRTEPGTEQECSASDPLSSVPDSTGHSRCAR